MTALRPSAYLCVLCAKNSLHRRETQRYAEGRREDLKTWARVERLPDAQRIEDVFGVTPTFVESDSGVHLVFGVG
jgi:hypothetical protein